LGEWVRPRGGKGKDMVGLGFRAPMSAKWDFAII